jgi:hypothetical protein
MRVHLWTAGAAAVVAVCSVWAFAARADAHPSDFRTLTVDLVVGDRGLELIDAAVVPAAGPNYDPFPTVASRSAVASRVLESLALPASGVVVDVENSERYHEVGFAIRVDERAAAAWHGRVDTASLQRIAADEGLDRLKLSVCAAGGATPAAASDVAIVASRPGQTGVSPNDREGCTTWVLGVDDDPVTITVGGPAALAVTGVQAPHAVGAALAVLVGAALVGLGRSVGPPRPLRGAPSTR